MYCTIWHNVVIRGDINIVKIAQYTSVGDRTVITTVASLPHGFPAVVHIGQHVTIQAGCSLTSCIIEDEAFVGANSVITEGCRIEKGAIILPNSVVPPGRLIPAGQVWGGNPVEYVRDALESEIFHNYASTYENFSLGEFYLLQFTPWSYNYLQKSSTRDDLDLNPEDLVHVGDKRHYRKCKYYYDYGLY